MDVHLTYWLTESLGDNPPVDALRVLNAGEQERCLRLSSAQDRRDYAAAHMLLRTALSTMAALPPAMWDFEISAHGKPCVAPKLSSRAPLSFNLTHTRGLVACAVVHDPRVEVGIDAEAIECCDNAAAVASRYFSNVEAADLAHRDSREAGTTFAEIWTLKEAYLKAIGHGLSAPLDMLTFRIAPDGRVTCESDDWIDVAAWHFASFAPSVRHRMALAVRDDSPTPPRVVVHEFQPR